MKTHTAIGILVALLLAFEAGLAPIASAQGAPPGAPGGKPIMENVFFNVVWGSVFGILMGSSAAAIESEVKTQPKDLSTRVALGATWGGILGLGVGIWLASNGITFDPGATLFDFSGPRQRPPISSNDPPLRFETNPLNPLQITGLQARVVDIKF